MNAQAIALRIAQLELESYKHSWKKRRKNNMHDILILGGGQLWQ